MKLESRNKRIKGMMKHVSVCKKCRLVSGKIRFVKISHSIPVYLPIVLVRKKT